MFKTIIGLDLASTFKKSKVGLAVLEKKPKGFSLSSTKLVKSTNEILAAIEEVRPPVLLAIDAPLKLPINSDFSYADIEIAEMKWPMTYTYRPWENLIFLKLKNEFEVSGRPFSSLTLTYRGIILKRLLEEKGWVLISSPNHIADYAFTEVFPNLTMNVLEKAKINEAGDKKEKRREFVTRLFAEGYHDVILKNETGAPLSSFMKKEDILDAIICAWTGALFAESQFKKNTALCLGDDEFGFVICPFSRQLEKHLISDGPENLIHNHTIFGNLD